MYHVKQEKQLNFEAPLSGGNGGGEGVPLDVLENAWLAPKGTQANPVQLSDAEDDEREANAERESRSQAVSRKRLRPAGMNRRFRERTGQKSVRVHKQRKYDTDSTSGDSDDTEQESMEVHHQAGAAQAWDGEIPSQNGIGEGGRHREEEVAESTGEAADAAHPGEGEPSDDDMYEDDEDDDSDEDADAEGNDDADDDVVILDQTGNDWPQTNGMQRESFGMSSRDPDNRGHGSRLGHSASENDGGLKEQEDGNEESSSDVEVVLMEEEGEARKRWEEAAQRRRELKSCQQREYSEWAEKRREAGLAAGHSRLLDLFPPLSQPPLQHANVLRSDHGAEFAGPPAGVERERNLEKCEAGPSNMEDVNGREKSSGVCFENGIDVTNGGESDFGGEADRKSSEAHAVPVVLPQDGSQPDLLGSKLAVGKEGGDSGYYGDTGAPSSHELEDDRIEKVTSVATGAFVVGSPVVRSTASHGEGKHERQHAVASRAESDCVNGDVGLNGDGGLKGDSVNFMEREGGYGGEGPEGIVSGELIGERERLKMSDEFQKADEEEWKRRQEELQRQALAAQIEKRRRRKEMEMNARTQQRLEEVRAQQATEEMQLAERENMKAQVHSELHGLVIGCSDLGAVLNRLGIVVDSWPNPSEAQVEKAYRKAQLKFHPDRASASKGLDPREQVHAEETFKLITKLKTQLPLVPKMVTLHNFKTFRSIF